jgi:prepilin-type N-terminal cleavage/methylation domain-containing protein
LNQVQDSRGFTLIELLMVMAIVGILLTLSMAGYRAARVRGGETAALAALHAINRAQFAYMQTCGNQRYAPTLTSLGAPVPSSGSPYLSPDLTSGDQVAKSGYFIQMAGTAAIEGPPTCTGAVPITSYQATADPMQPGISGLRYFGTNTDRIVFEDEATFTANMPETGPPEHGREVGTPAPARAPAP